GDIIDGWRLKKKFFWPQSHNDVIQKILRKARKGTRVVYVPGNHDEGARQFVDMKFGDIEILDEAFHETVDGKRLWVVHGDKFDGIMQHARWVAHIGDFAYTTLLVINNHLNAIRRLFKLPYWSLSQYLKHKVKGAVSFISTYEKVMVTQTKRKGCDGVVCGHIHKAEIRDIDGILYANDGDWVESLSALVEHDDGRLEIIYWDHLVDSLSDDEDVPETALAS
ncbi:MAG TPA: UDP-2,3-diacylglucosamine hydrolase, partial [Rhodobiaceae bacterium]|nr:UDP-2,3-diacylglucosamine hydrolase [Rhodobiaceae bacterium]